MNYLITLSGSGAEVGVGKISKAQFDYWSKEENAENLNWEIQGDLDDDEDVPEDVRLSEHYEYMDVYCQSGVYENSLEIEIQPVDDDGDAFSFSGDYEDFIDSFTFDEAEPIVEQTVQYPSKKDHYIAWVAEESGPLIEEEIELEDGEEFDPKKVKLIYTRINSQLRLVTGIQYDGFSLSGYTDEFEKSGEMEAHVFKHG